MSSLESYGVQSNSEVSESALEYLLGEILSINYLGSSDEKSANDGSELEFIKLQRLDDIGYNVGYRLVERMSTVHKLLGPDPLDAVKFLCKEFWEQVFKKKIDKLQTNHKGVFVLSDTKFKWLDRYASDDIASKQAAVRMLNFPCGILRGALANLGCNAIVNAEFNQLPGCTFNIRVKTQP